MLQASLERWQTHDHVAFHPDSGIDDALVRSEARHWNSKLILRLRILNVQFLVCQRVNRGCLVILCVTYHQLIRTLHTSAPYPSQRAAKQRDVIKPLSFNVSLDSVTPKWKVGNSGFDFGGKNG